MTLNITVVTERRIYQCVDYRLTDTATGRPYDDAANQKIMIAVGKMWLATVCFNGVGRTGSLETSEWLSDVCSTVTFEDPFDSLLERLRTADQWLSRVPAKHRRHSFIVGTFLGWQPVIALVSNYERFDRPPAATPASALSIHRLEPSRSQTFVSGQPNEVRRPRRRFLASLAETQPDRVPVALASVNREVASQNDLVSPSCFTSCISRTGEAAGRPHDMTVPARLHQVALPGVRRRDAGGLLSQKLKGGAVRQFAMACVWASDEFHAIQLADKGGSADTHSNFGAYLQDKKGDLEGAERAYRKALAIDPTHANALTNLADLRAARGEIAEAEELYRTALHNAPRHENASVKYANFLLQNGRDLHETRAIVDEGLRAFPNSGRLHCLLGEIELDERRGAEALEQFSKARELGMDQVPVEVGYAFALHISGAPTSQCILAYRTAIALSPSNPGLRLNMAQLLLAEGREEEGAAMLARAIELGLDDAAKLAAFFYLLAHNGSDIHATIKAMRVVLERGSRLEWNVSVNVASVAARDARRAELLERVASVLRGAAAIETLVQLETDLSG